MHRSAEALIITRPTTDMAGGPCHDAIEGTGFITETIDREAVATPLDLQDLKLVPGAAATIVHGSADPDHL